MAFLQSLTLDGFLSFAPGSKAIPLTALNVLIGPNGSGKTNLIEAIGVLHATPFPRELASLVRAGGTAEEWLWKGEPTAKHASIEVSVEKNHKAPLLRYCLSCAPASLGMNIVEESIVETKKNLRTSEVILYQLKGKRADLAVTERRGLIPVRKLMKIKPDDLLPDESILSQRKDPSVYPELTWLAQQFGRIQTFRDWTFGRSAPLRRPQRGDLPIDELLPSSDNLGLVLNELQHQDVIERFNKLLCRFLPRYQRFSTRMYGGAVQLYLHESGLTSPVPATRLSDGTIRFMAMLALLFSPTPPPLLCVEEPELGLHPDAVSLLADLIVEASTRMQLIVTTHSEALVSALTDYANSVLVCENLGGTQIQRIESSRILDLLESYRLGEIWSIGEIGGNP